ncbi:unnamed protein product [Rhodiola kirilowii]
MRRVWVMRPLMRTLEISMRLVEFMQSHEVIHANAQGYKIGQKDATFHWHANACHGPCERMKATGVPVQSAVASTVHTRLFLYKLRSFSQS